LVALPLFVLEYRQLLRSNDLLFWEKRYNRAIQLRGDPKTSEDELLMHVARRFRGADSREPGALVPLDMRPMFSKVNSLIRQQAETLPYPQDSTADQRAVIDRMNQKSRDDVSRRNRNNRVALMSDLKQNSAPYSSRRMPALFGDSREGFQIHLGYLLPVVYAFLSLANGWSWMGYDTMAVLYGGGDDISLSSPILTSSLGGRLSFARFTGG
jgi:hypothetical protein